MARWPSMALRPRWPSMVAVFSTVSGGLTGANGRGSWRCVTTAVLCVMGEWGGRGGGGTTGFRQGSAVRVVAVAGGRGRVRAAGPCGASYMPNVGLCLVG